MTAVTIVIIMASSVIVFCLGVLTAAWQARRSGTGPVHDLAERKDPNRK